MKYILSTAGREVCHVHATLVSNTTFISLDCLFYSNIRVIYTRILLLVQVHVSCIHVNVLSLIIAFKSNYSLIIL